MQVGAALAWPRSLSLLSTLKNFTGAGDENLPRQPGHEENSLTRHSTLYSHSLAFEAGILKGL